MEPDDRKGRGEKRCVYVDFSMRLGPFVALFASYVVPRLGRSIRCSVIYRALLHDYRLYQVNKSLVALVCIHNDSLLNSLHVYRYIQANFCAHLVPNRTNRSISSRVMHTAHAHIAFRTAPAVCKWLTAPANADIMEAVPVSVPRVPGRTSERTVIRAGR